MIDLHFDSHNEFEQFKQEMVDQRLTFWAVSVEEPSILKDGVKISYCAEINHFYNEIIIKGILGSYSVSVSIPIDELNEDIISRSITELKQMILSDMINNIEIDHDSINKISALCAGFWE